MLTSNDMQKVLNIQDKNIIFKDNCVTYGECKIKVDSIKMKISEACTKKKGLPAQSITLTVNGI